jgi:hypothetical protein
MTVKTYSINKGVGRPITFRGLRAQYIWYLGAAVIADLILFAILYIGGLSSYLCVLIALGLGTLLIMGVYRMSNKYGEFGLMKSGASRHIPAAIRTYSRERFTTLKRPTWKKY